MVSIDGRLTVANFCHFNLKSEKFGLAIEKGFVLYYIETIMSMINREILPIWRGIYLYNQVELAAQNMYCVTLFGAYFMPQDQTRVVFLPLRVSQSFYAHISV
jgi:hypothetical protein